MGNDLTPTSQQPLAVIFERLASPDYSHDLPAETDVLAVIKVLDNDSNPAGLEKATLAARRIMGFYPRADYDDPETFMSGVVATLVRYPAGVLRRVSDPYDGIAGRLKFLPRIAEIREACDAEMKKRADARKHAGFAIWGHRRKSIDENDNSALLRALEQSMTAVGLCRDAKGGWKIAAPMAMAA
jgi:hypothetical protein